MADYVPLAHVTTRLTDHPHEGLLREKGGRGFPTLAWLDADGTVLGRHQGERTVAALRATAAKVQRSRTLRAEVAAGTPGLEAELLLLEIDLDLLDFPAARDRAAAVTCTDVERTQLDDRLVNLEYRWLMDQQRARAITREAAGARLAAMFRAGQVPSQDWYRRGFFTAVMVHAESPGVRDPDLYADAFGKFKELMGDDRRFAVFYGKCEEALAKLRAERAPTPAPDPPPGGKEEDF